MGIRGLSKFIDEQHPDFYTAYKLHDTPVVIDGANLVHYLYTNSKADFMFGGNYDEYSEAIRQYFSSVIECNICPIVVFDGGFHTSGRMFNQLRERQDQRLEKVKILISEWEGRETILPINAFEVFKEVLSEMDIKFIQCDYEGDNQMASLANDYRCPVLSNDSDFYIYDLHYGFIRLSYVDSQVRRGKNKKGKLFKYLNCDIYYSKILLEFFSLKDSTILPLYGVILGNDYSTYEDFKDLFYKIRVMRKNRFTGLLFWLSKYNLNQAIRQVLYLTEEDKRDDIKNLIENAIDDYQLKPTSLKDIFVASRIRPSDEIIRNSRIFTPCGSKLPASFVIALHNGLPPALLNIITLHLKLLSPYVEEPSYVSCHACSRYIRQVMYGIVLQHSVVSPRKHAKECLRRIYEYDRVNGKIQRLSVEYLTRLRNGRNVPSLNEMYGMRMAHLRDFIGELLGLPNSFFTDLPSSQQLLFGCINYWLKNCVPKPTKDFLYALLLCIIYFQVKKACRQGNGSNPLINLVLFQNISLHTAQIVFRNLSSYLHKPSLDYKHPLKLHTVYSYNQLQACVHDVGQLNLLANLPYESLRLSKVFSGTMLYNLTEDIHSFRNQDGSVRNLLGQQSEAMDLFYFLKDKALWNTPLNYFAPTPTWREPR